MTQIFGQNCGGKGSPIGTTIFVCVVSSLVLIYGTGFATQPTELRDRSAQQSMAAGVAAFEKGSLDEAIACWKKAARVYEGEKDAKGHVEALVNLGAAYNALGQHKFSVRTLEEAVELAEKSKDRSSQVLAKSSLGAALTSTRRTDSAEQNLTESLAMARADRNLATEAVILNNLGNVFAQQNRIAEALDAFRECTAVSQQITNRLLAAKAASNAAATAARGGRESEANRLNASAVDQVRSLTPSHDQALLLNRLGQTDWQLSQHASDAKSQLLKRAAESHQQAQQVAEKIGDRRALTYALGYLGQVRESERQYAAALSLTRRAAFVAQEIQLPDALYLWEWQTGRLYEAQGDPKSAIEAYRRARQALQSVRHDLSLGYGLTGSSFREEVGPLFFELADLLIQQAESAKNQQERKQLLLEARDTVEQLKSAELEDYFQDECVNLLRAKAQRIENVDPQTAVIYIIPLANRTELLVSVGSELLECKVPVGTEELNGTVRQFRVNLETRTTREYFTQAQQLYKWLIAPIKEILTKHQVQTLVFVPDGALRTIPMAALHDGEQFLIEQYAVASTPGLTLMEPKPIERKNVQILVAGLSEAVQGFPALPYVPAELKNVRGLFTGRELLNQDFRLPTLTKDFTETEYRMIHLATHGEFNKDVGKSFILSYDGRLTLDQLEELIRPCQFRGKPVELLTLSACQTAAGDDRAALGLAGVAVKAGAKSALATLWFINDESTSSLVGEFYTQLHRNPSLSKAKALQQAQIKLLADRRTRHPCYWAPYLIIGNWL